MAQSATLIVSILSLLFLLPSPSTANEHNVMVTGDILPTDAQLSYGRAVFVIQNDCNLVLYNQGNGFQSNTAGRGTNCTLTLSDFGEFIIRNGNGNKIWSSRAGSRKGNYAAVLGPDGLVNVFGPSIWFTPPFHSSPADMELKSIPMVRNLMFSSQVLSKNDELTSRDYKFIMTEDCNLEFRKASMGVVWESNTKGNGQHCFARLNHRGQLSIIGDNNEGFWTSTPPAREGDYVLIVGINGQAVIYGPIIFTAGSVSGSSGGILAQVLGRMPFY